MCELSKLKTPTDISDDAWRKYYCQQLYFELRKELLVRDPIRGTYISVSYTHLTLPTNREV